MPIFCSNRKTRTLTLDALLQELVEVLAQADAEFIVETYNRVVPANATLNPDGKTVTVALD